MEKINTVTEDDKNIWRRIFFFGIEERETNIWRRNILFCGGEEKTEKEKVENIWRICIFANLFGFKM